MKFHAILGACALMTIPGMALAEPTANPVKLAPPAKLAAMEAKTLPQQTPNQVLASKLIGAEVYSPANEKVGKIEYLVMSKDGRVDAAVVGVGGFLGIDRKDVALSFGSLDVTYDADNSVKKVNANVSKDSLKAAPAFVFLNQKS